MFLFKRNGYYYIEYLEESSRKKKRISTKCSQKSEALIFLSNFKYEIKLSKRPRIISLKEFTEIYKVHIKNGYSEKYLSSVEYSFKKFNEAFPEKKLSELTVNDAELFIVNSYSKKKYAALLYYKTLKAALSKAVNWGFIDQNPFKKFKSPHSPKKFPLFFTSEEFETILSSETKVTLRNLYLLDFNTGMRLGEIINLEWRDIDNNLNFLKVANKEYFTTKSKEERIIPLNETSKKLLIAQRLFLSEKNDYVFTNNLGGKFELDYVSKTFKKRVISAGVNSKIHFHSIRHSFASNLAQKGVSLYIIKSLLGHASISTTEIYSHLNQETLERAIQLL